MQGRASVFLTKLREREINQAFQGDKNKTETRVHLSETLPVAW